MHRCSCGERAAVETRITYLSGAIETQYHCGAHARLYRWAALRLGYSVQGDAA